MGFRSLKQARQAAEDSVRGAHPGKMVRFGEPVAQDGGVTVPYVAGRESGESHCPLDKEFSPVQTFNEHD